MFKLSLLLSVAAVAGFFAQPPAAWPGQGAKLLIENPRVSVWEIAWTKGRLVPSHEYALDTVLVPLSDVQLGITPAGGARRTASLKVGDMILLKKGTVQAELGLSDGRVIMTSLKEFKAPPIPNPTKYGPAFPRPGVKQLIETDRIIGWDYTWVPGQPTPMHFHDKDVVLSYVGAGALNSTEPNGKVSLNEFAFGETRFNPGNRTHFEEYLRGDHPRAIVMELK